MSVHVTWSNPKHQLLWLTQFRPQGTAPRHPLPYDLETTGIRVWKPQTFEGFPTANTSHGSDEGCFSAGRVWATETPGCEKRLMNLSIPFFQIHECNGPSHNKAPSAAVPNVYILPPPHIPICCSGGPPNSQHLHMAAKEHFTTSNHSYCS